MKKKKLEERIKKQEQLVAKAQEALARYKKSLRETERKERNRRLILMGVYAEKLCEIDPDFRVKMEKYIDENEKKEINRKLFDFLPENQGDGEPGESKAKPKSKFGP